MLPKARIGVRRALAVALAVALAACASGDDPGQRGATTSAIGARLAPIAGGVGHGLITFKPYDGGLVMVADVGGFSSGAVPDRHPCHARLHVAERILGRAAVLLPPPGRR